MPSDSEQCFRKWLLAQVGRPDAVGRLGRDVSSEERRLRRPLPINEYVGLIRYASTIPAEVNVSRSDVKAAWREYLEGIEPVAR